jgi:mediator of RNA polymerase II transcription subunit 31
MADVEPAPDGVGRSPPYKDPDDGRQRFLLELEFVQCLANPTYIHCMVLSASAPPFVSPV